MSDELKQVIQLLIRGLKLILTGLEKMLKGAKV